jgi:hypothetical protein
MSEGDVEEIKMAWEAPDELATARGEAARAIHEDPEGMFAGLSEELPGVDRRALERPEVRAFLIETFQEAVRQGATGWIDDELRQVRPWPFRLEEISGVDVRLHHGEADVLVPAHHAKHLAEGIPGSRLQLYPDEGISPSTNTSRRSFRRCSLLNRIAAVHIGRYPSDAIHPSTWKDHSPKFASSIPHSPGRIGPESPARDRLCRPDASKSTLDVVALDGYAHPCMRKVTPG